jgi:hypothetical protein
MARITQGLEPKGSQHWLQAVAKKERDLFERAITRAGIAGVQWLSPLESDDYAEYQDDDFISLLELDLPYRSVKSFWPARGPVWDGLARSGSGSVLLIEANGNILELQTHASQASPASAVLIGRSMGEAKPTSWTAAAASGSGRTGWCEATGAPGLQGPVESASESVL